MACDKFVTFNNDLKMPALGIGTWQAPEDEIKSALNHALAAGYRHIDTAPVYKNEKAIGNVLKSWLDSGKLTRDEIFITTKLAPSANIPIAVEACLKQSLADLQLSYVDLYLIHVPFGVLLEGNEFKRTADGEVVVDPHTDHIALWKKMEEMVQKGLTRSIGISNFNQKQIQRILNISTIKPANLQIEHHIYLQQKELIDFCKKNGVTVTAYAPLGSRDVALLNKSVGIERPLPKLMECNEVKQLAADHNKTPAQILLRWIIERGLAAIPKSTNPERLKQNLDIFDFSLNEKEINTLNALDADFRVCDFKFFKGVEKHPEFPF